MRSPFTSPKTPFLDPTNQESALKGKGTVPCGLAHVHCGAVSLHPVNSLPPGLTFDTGKPRSARLRKPVPMNLPLGTADVLEAEPVLHSLGVSITVRACLPTLEGSHPGL